MELPKQRSCSATWGHQGRAEEPGLAVEGVFAGGFAEGGVFGGEELFEARFVDGLHVGLFGADHAGAEFFPDGFVHELHAFGFAADDDVVEFLSGAFPDNCGDGGGGEHDFVHRDAAGFVGPAHEELGDDATEGGGEHGADLRLLICGEHVDETVDGLPRVVGVQGAENEEPGLCCGEGEGDCFQVPHFTHEDDVGILAEGGAESVGETGGLDGDFALGNDGLFATVDEFDRFLDGDDVPGEVDVDVVEQCGERGGFSGAGGTGDEDKAGAHVAEFLDDEGDIEVLEGGDFGGDQTEDGGEAILLFEVVAPESGILIHLVSKVEVAEFEVVGEGFFIADFSEELFEVVSCKDLFAFDGGDCAVDTGLGDLSFGEVEVGATDFDQVFEVFVDSCHGIWAGGQVRTGRRLSFGLCPRSGRGIPPGRFVPSRRGCGGIHPW